MSKSDRFRFALLPLVLVFQFVAFDSNVEADKPTIEFDVPALVGVREVADAEGNDPTSGQKIIEVVIPVSSEVESGNRGAVKEFRYDIYWNRNVYPLADYAPRSQTASHIDGLISVEETEGKNGGVGINVSSKYLDMVSGSINADVSKQIGTKRTYSEVPQHEVLVASGTVHRGTGAFFRFHPSKRETLEGGRDLIVAFRVPQSWRGGVLKIECRAAGYHKVFGTWREEFEAEQAFVVPIYLENDDQARQAAFEFVRSEQGLRRDWLRFQQRAMQKNVGLFGKPTRSPISRLPNQWVHYLIQSGHDDYLKKYRSRLPDELASSAEKFAAARHGLLEFSR